jgi:hypothetical protein
MSNVDLLQAIASYMDEAERHYQLEGGAENGLIVAEILGDDGSWRVYIQITDNEEARRVVIHADLPVRIPETNRLKVAELLTRINYELIVGNFELNFEDGTVLFKTTLDLADGQLTQAMFERMYEINGHSMNQNYAKILSVGYGEAGSVKLVEESRPDGVSLQ